MVSPLLIHEFSTGITPEGNRHRWVSKGFTGRYMNTTLNLAEFPKAIERAIANHSFAVAEGSSSDKPAIIGRVVTGTNDHWSVIAFVTRGEDEFGRGFGFHRYFLCQGLDRLWMLIEWLEDYLRKNGQYPIFNPFELKEVGKPNIWHNPSHPSEGRFSAPVNSKAPEILSWRQDITLTQINCMAEQKANGQIGQVAWALNVEALEQPERFLVIKPASAQAEQILQQPVLAPARQTVVNSAIDEQAIKGAIKGLINSSQVNEKLFESLIDNITIVENELREDNLISQYWQDVFNGQGASNAISQGIRSPQMVRLLTLRAIVIPDTLPKYLTWLKIEKASHQTTNSLESLKFQQKLQMIARGWLQTNPSLLNKLGIHLIEGLKIQLYQLYLKGESTEAIKKKMSIEPEIWLFGSKEGLWALYKKDLENMMNSDLGLIEIKRNEVQGIQTQQIQSTTNQTYQLDGKGWNRIRQNIVNYRQKELQSSSNTSTVGKVFKAIILGNLIPHHQEENQGKHGFWAWAELFREIDSPILAACFYQLSNDLVPAKVYNNARRYLSHPQSSQEQLSLFGIPLKRAKSPVQKVLKTVFLIILVSIAASSFRIILSTITEPQSVVKPPKITIKSNHRNIGLRAAALQSHPGILEILVNPEKDPRNQKALRQIIFELGAQSLNQKTSSRNPVDFGLQPPNQQISFATQRDIAKEIENYYNNSNINGALAEKDIPPAEAVSSYQKNRLFFKDPDGKISLTRKGILEDTGQCIVNDVGEILGIDRRYPNQKKCPRISEETSEMSQQIDQKPTE